MKKLVKGLDLFAIKFNSRDNSVMLKLTILLTAAVVFLSTKVWSQNPQTPGVRFLSEIDNQLTLNTITVGPAADNVGGVYKKSAEEKLRQLISADHIWSFAENSETLRIYTIGELFEDAQKSKDLLARTNADGFLVVNIVKGNEGLSVEMTLFSNFEGLPIAQVHQIEPEKFTISDFEKMIENLYAKIKASMPYSGLVKSRKGNSLTINLGTSNQIKVGDQITFIQILNIKRHPTLNFIVSVDKEIIGQGTVKKIDDTLSFIEISYEKEPGVVQKNAKIQRLANVVYNDLNIQDKDKNDPTKQEEWLPPPIPQFGFVYAGFGLTDYKTNTILQDGTTINSGNSFAPSFNIGAELWITKNLMSQFTYKQIIFAGKNSYAGSDPGNINFNISETNFAIGFRQQITDNFWGPHVSALLGQYGSNHQVSDSQPTAFTSMRVTGMSLLLGGYFPVSKNNDIAIGVDTKFVFSPKVTESPVNSGDTDTKMSDFTFYGIFQWTTNMQFKGLVQSNSIQANFSGTPTRVNPARSAEIKSTTYAVNLEYLF
jgi:hypothetical protein